MLRATSVKAANTWRDEPADTVVLATEAWTSQMPGWGRSVLPVYSLIVLTEPLDEGRWEPMFGGRWSQRGGRILVDQPGDGFGGRALCLVRQAPERVPYELSVQVKLHQEDGAAGIAFLSDGNFRHYGFYPTSGKLRVEVEGVGVLRNGVRG
jgi:glycine/D-amino acid oxidase-like deaminating enzyme